MLIYREGKAVLCVSYLFAVYAYKNGVKAKRSREMRRWGLRDEKLLTELVASSSIL